VKQAFHEYVIIDQIMLNNKLIIPNNNGKINTMTNPAIMNKAYSSLVS